MNNFGFWDTRHPVSISHCFTPNNAVVRAQRQRLARQRSDLLGLQSIAAPQEMVFYLSPHALESSHQISAIKALLDPVGS